MVVVVVVVAAGASHHSAQIPRKDTPKWEK